MKASEIIHIVKFLVKHSEDDVFTDSTEFWQQHVSKISEEAQTICGSDIRKAVFLLKRLKNQLEHLRRRGIRDDLEAMEVLVECGQLLRDLEKEEAEVR